MRAVDADHRVISGDRQTFSDSHYSRNSASYRGAGGALSADEVRVVQVLSRDHHDQQPGA
jgi:hypothetical protein